MPLSSNHWAFFFVRLKPVTVCPLSIRRLTMLPPITPRPINPRLAICLPSVSHQRFTARVAIREHSQKLIARPTHKSSPARARFHQTPAFQQLYCPSEGHTANTKLYRQSTL